MKLISEIAPTQSCATAQINNAITFLYNKLFVDAVSEIKSNLKPTFNRPYLWVNVQNSLKIRGLYDTGADISCISEKIFRQIPPQNRPTKLAIDKSPNFRSAGGQPLPVRGLYKFAFMLNGKQIELHAYRWWVAKLFQARLTFASKAGAWRFSTWVSLGFTHKYRARIKNLPITIVQADSEMTLCLLSVSLMVRQNKIQ